MMMCAADGHLLAINVRPWGAVSPRMQGAMDSRRTAGITLSYPGWMHLLTGGAGQVPPKQLITDQLLKVQAVYTQANARLAGGCTVATMSGLCWSPRRPWRETERRISREGQRGPGLRQRLSRH